MLLNTIVEHNLCESKFSPRAGNKKIPVIYICWIQILLINSKNLCAQMTAWFNTSIPFYSDSVVPAHSHCFKMAGSQILGLSVFTPKWRWLTQLSAKWILYRFCWLMGLEPSLSDPIRWCLPYPRLAPMLRQEEKNLDSLTRSVDLGEKSTFIIYRRSSWSLSAWSLCPWKNHPTLFIIILFIDLCNNNYTLLFQLSLAISKYF